MGKGGKEPKHDDKYTLPEKYDNEEKEKDDVGKPANNDLSCGNDSLLISNSQCDASSIASSCGTDNDSTATDCLLKPGNPVTIQNLVKEFSDPEFEVVGIQEIDPSFKGKQPEIPDIIEPTPIDRGNWGGQLQFILTCVGYAVGLGNVWRFPYLCYKNGGGAFLVPYIIMLAVVGLPLFYMELAFGQFASMGPITIWSINPLFKGLGYAMVIVCWFIGLYYNVVIAHCLFYLYSSMTSVLPWTTCNNPWNTIHCITASAEAQGMMNRTSNMTDIVNATLGSATVMSITANVTLGSSTESIIAHGNNTVRTASEEFFKRYVLEESDSFDNFGSMNYKLAISLFVAWLIVYVALLKGVQSLGKVVYFTAIFPYVMLVILFIRGVTLDGAVDGIIYYLKPDFSRLADSRVWSDAATQIFYSLSACTGGLICMSSFNKFSNNCYRDSLIVALINCGTSIFAGLVIFSILGFMAHEKGVDVASVADDGPGLAFVVYPEAIARMPVSPLWAILFFLMMATLGFGSEFSTVECILSAFIDEFKPFLQTKKRVLIFRSIVILSMFLLGLPMVCQGGMWLLNLVDYSVSGFPLLVVGLMELVCIAWIYGFDRFSEDIEMMIGRKPNIYWQACWKYIAPTAISVTIVFNIVFFKAPELDERPYPSSAIALSWCIALFPIIVIFGYFIIAFCRSGGYQLMKERMSPLPSWGPSKYDDRNKDNKYEIDRATFKVMFSSASSFESFKPKTWFNSTSTLNIAGSTPASSMLNIASPPSNVSTPIPPARVAHLKDEAKQFPNGGLLTLSTNDSKV